MSNKLTTIENIKIRLLYLFVFSICFQTVKIFGAPYLSITWVIFFMYFIANLFTYKKSFVYDAKIRFYVQPIALYLLLVLVMTYVNYEPYARIVYAELRQMLMGIVLLWIMINHLKGKRYEQVRLLHIFVLSNVVLAFSSLLGIQTNYSYDGRLSVWGNNSNSISLWAGFSVLILIQMMFEEKRRIIVKAGFVVLMTMQLIVIIKTGSRGGLATFITGYIVYFIMIKQPLKFKIITMIVSVISGVLGLFYMLNTPLIKTRIAEQLEDDSFGGRRPIWEAGIEMFKNSPIFGVGAGRYEIEFIDITGKFAATHNEYLTILLYTGIVGIFVFILFQYHLLKGVINCEKSPLSALMYSFIAMYLIWMISAGGAFPALTTWFVWAIIALSGITSNMYVKNYSFPVESNQYAAQKSKYSFRL